MLTGSVKMVSERGFGFIKPDGQALDVFVHASTIQQEGQISWPLKVGARVSFELTTRSHNGRPQACNVKLLEQAMAEPLMQTEHQRKQAEIDRAWAQRDRGPVRMGDDMA
jgi:CspA family cold shock protein